MSIKERIIVTDTNIITDLSNANVLEEFILLDNVYISDMVKSDEINYKTCNCESIDRLKTISLNAEQLKEVYNLSTIESGLSPYDLISYVIARDNNYILATGDNRLRNYSLSNGVSVIRTLKIIELMAKEKIISNKKAIDACNLLKMNPSTRIPINYINNLINKLNKDLSLV